MTAPSQAAALHAFEAAIAAADPGAAVAHGLEQLDIAPDAGGRLVVLALGKAAPAMADAALGALPAASDALIVTAPGTALGTAPGNSGAQVLFGSHPVPDAASEAAGAALLEKVSGLSEKDRVLALISGGGSALAVAPAPGVSLADKAALNEVLLASGLDVVAMNLIRQQVSRLKGGGLAAAAAPAPVTALILSDVIGDDLSAVASGPTTPPVGTATEAEATARAAGIWGAFPASIRAAIRAAVEAARDEAPPDARNILVGSNDQSVRAAARALGGLRTLETPLVGDVTDAAPRLIAAAASGSFVTGGETTVRLTGNGIGGRNQDLALRFALLAEEAGLPGDWVFLSGGTDGRDGPTDAAGAIVTPQTLAQICAKGIDPAGHLAENNAYPALAAANALIKRPPSGTNVADIQIFLNVTPT